MILPIFTCSYHRLIRTGQPSFIEYFDLANPRNGTALQSTMAGLFQAGGCIGTILLPNLADRYGRRSAMAVAGLLCLISGAVMTGSTNVAEFIVFRFFAGAGGFMLAAAVPLWMGEVVPVDWRGALVDIHAISLMVGYMIQGWVGFGFYFWKTGGSNTWRPPIALQCAFSIFFLISLYWLPESPRWLVMQDRVDEARAVLDRLHWDPKDDNNEYSRAELYQIQKQVAIDKTLDSSWIHMFRKPSYRKRAFFAMGTTGIIQCSGVLVINLYGPSLYKQLGFSPIKQLLYPAAWLTFTLGANAIAIPFIDAFPRNKFLAVGVAGCTATLIVEAALVANFVPSDNENALLAAVAMFFVFQLFYSFFLDGKLFMFL